LLTGRTPFSEPHHDTFAKKGAAHLREPEPAILDYRSDVPECVSTIVGRMMAKDPERRFPTARDVARALEPRCVGNDLQALASEQRTQASAERPAR
jgi:eukaryotic-like serine/threonine-protein kinase